jgi:hypothetical protein
MRRVVQRIFLASFLTIYGVVTVVGPALHALPGFTHSLAKLGSDDDSASGQPSRSDIPAHDCPICQFHAQGQLIAGPDNDRCIEVVRIRPPDELPLFSPPALDQPSSPRAPPFG